MAPATSVAFFTGLVTSIFLGLGPLLLVGCGEAGGDDPEGAVGGGGPEAADPADLDPVPDSEKADGVPGAFDPNRVVDDAFFSDTGYIDAAGVQAFLEDSPYGTKSWLAAELIGGRRFSDILVESSVAAGLNPMVLLTRMQVEQGLISKTQRPSASRVNYALGCGCPDGRGCSSAYSGLDRQIRCALDTQVRLLDESRAGTGNWVKGRTRRTRDGIDVTPRTHATAALYAYTPWVLRGRGGNWLVWNVLRKFDQHVVAAGLGGSTRGGGFIGDPCTADFDCDYDGAFCLFVDGAATGYCTRPCLGTCPDRQGYPITRCVEAGETDLCLIGCGAGGACGAGRTCQQLLSPAGAPRDVCWF